MILLFPVGIVQILNIITNCQHDLIMDAVIELYDRIVDRNLLVRRINITANRLVDESSVKKEEVYEQLDLFTDYEAQRKNQEEEEAALDREKRMQEAMLSIKKKFVHFCPWRLHLSEDSSPSAQRFFQISF